MASTSDHENPLLTGIEKKELANLLSNMPDKPTPFLSLSSDLSAHAVSETLPSAQRVPETPDDGCPSLLRSPTGVCDLGALQEDNDFFHIPDNLLLGETEKDDFELTKEISFPLSKSRLVNNMYIENKCALVNSMIVNFSETINLMKDMREQSQKIQQQLHDLGDKVNIPHLEPARQLRKYYYINIDVTSAMASIDDSERNLLTGVEKKQLAKLLPDTLDLSLSSALAFSDGNAINIQSDSSGNSSTLFAEVSEGTVPDFLRSPTGVCELETPQDGGELLNFPNELLLGDAEDDDLSCNMSIQSKCVLVNSMIAKSLSKTIDLMSNMREQSQKIQQQLHDLGDKVNIPHLEPAPELEIKEDEEGICTWPQIAPSPPPPNYRVIQKQTKSRRDCSGKQKFPSILHRLLLDLESMDDGSSIARFSPDGKAFVITDSVKFEKRVLSKYFPRMKNFSSFHRQLNLYDFERLSSHAKHAYYHALFRRDQPVCAALMRPTRIKGAFSK
eukprot:CAMPEP_0194229080 /NCGR_PEP_ID=MMETSP0156-20130528/43708_1 /TAXON_ID=33649 /ORGANISM="Thalassionema nitzschioides, Strain L26-B" /LENGTH=501 /DNA_ID=CAMNT_0038961617 /DNA_START=36 /DNA_END=1542 /DNA_ORIENTATION=-